MPEDPQKFRRDRASDLEIVGSFLQRNKICLDTSPIQAAASMCRTNKPNGENSWGYSLSGLSFKFKPPQKTKPDNISNILDLELNVNLSGKCTPEQWDYLSSLSIDIEITGSNNESHQLLSAWHFDRHQWSDGDGEPEEIHPLYHCHHGGRRMTKLENFGNVLLLNPPRLPHPPMDAILAIDFVLSNFLPDSWKLLRDESTYTKRLFTSQKLLLAPYFDSLASEIRKPDGANPVQLWPIH